MRLNRIFDFIAAAIVFAAVASSCEKHPKNGTEETPTTIVNFFAKNVIRQYYLWTDEIKDKIDNWDLKADPVFNVKDARYVLADGTQVDRWTSLYEDIEAIQNHVAGSYRTYGMEYKLYYANSEHTSIIAIVTYVYAGSPAEAAGLKRGDVVTKVNGREMTIDNYVEIVEKDIDSSDSIALTLRGREGDIIMEAVEMYLDPVLTYSCFDCSGKKVGYLVYTSFNAASCKKLIEACKYFKSEGVTELILDLRYNGGGLVLAHELLASMLAPEKDVLAGNVYTQEVYNAELSEVYESITTFTNAFSFESGGKKYELSTADANVPLTKIYALVTRSTASASEALITGLAPYIDIEILGEQTHGKFCSGIIMSSYDWYKSVRSQLPSRTYEHGLQYSEKWGIYVMIGRYADKDGNTPCMPSGFVPDVEVVDNPTDGYQLGNPDETMLHAALVRAGYPDSDIETKSVSNVSYEMAPFQGRRFYLAVHE